MVVIESLQPEDRSGWEELARGYKAFYQTPATDAEYEATWRQLQEEDSGFYALGARLVAGDGELIGITHYFFHPFFWYGEACYLQDLFVTEAARGRGAARALIQAVAAEARAKAATRLYWNTQEDNVRARVLYDKVARFNGFIRYDYPL
jgi:GNAT superfamily N-acetyltransferase